MPVIRDGTTVSLRRRDSRSSPSISTTNCSSACSRRSSKACRSILWRYIENEIEGADLQAQRHLFRGNRSAAPTSLASSGTRNANSAAAASINGANRQNSCSRNSTERLVPFEQMLEHRAFCSMRSPRFVDFDLYGMLANFLYSGHYSLPARAHAAERMVCRACLKLNLCNSRRLQ